MLFMTKFVDYRENVIYFYAHNEHNLLELYSAKSDAYQSYRCGYCNRVVHGLVVSRIIDDEEGYESIWLLCPNCKRGSVKTPENVIVPYAKASANIPGLSPNLEKAYNEAGDCLSIGSFTACEMVCRKILMSVAVDRGAKENLTFKQYVNYLESNGDITSNMKPWVVFIKDSGNDANHELALSSKEHAESTFDFTTQLLTLIYGMQHRINKHLDNQKSS